jgi:hypothetical protein
LLAGLADPDTETEKLRASLADPDVETEKLLAGLAANSSFAAAVAMLDRLPLTDAERAEAVRRMLGGRQV